MPSPTIPEMAADLELVKHILEGLDHRVQQLEARLPLSHVAFGLTKEVGEEETVFHVHMVDHYGRPAQVTFTLQNEDL
jgi:hypothetical protein